MMMSRFRKKKGFTLLELVISMAISFLLLLVIYYAYFLAKTLFTISGDIMQEEYYVRTVFARISDDLQYVSRLNRLSSDLNELDFEIFNYKTLETDSASNDKKVQGLEIYYTTTEKTTGEMDYLILMKKVDTYTWWMKFGHDQMPSDEEEPFGYPKDMKDTDTGKKAAESLDATEVLDQEIGKEFLMKDIKFRPFDTEGRDITESAEGAANGYDYSVLKKTRSMRIDMDYVVAGEVSAEQMTSPRKKHVSKSVLFISFRSDTYTTQEVKVFQPSYGSIGFGNFEKNKICFPKANAVGLMPQLSFF